MTPELQQEKATQHTIMYAQFLAKELCKTEADACDILMAAAARAYANKHKTAGQPEEWLGTEFAQYMRETIIEQCWPPIERLGAPG